MNRNLFARLPGLFYVWKVAYIIKGLLTWIPGLYSWRLQKTSTGGTASPRYCYSVWLRHLVMLSQYGFRISDAEVGELGPGDSIGCGLASLLSGAKRYVGLDVVPFATKTNSEEMFTELVRLYSCKEPIPNHHEFPHVRPRLMSYDFPASLLDCKNVSEKVEQIQTELRTGVTRGQFVEYLAPWTTLGVVGEVSLDLIFSQAVLEHVEGLESVYRIMFSLLKPGGYASHVIDFGCHHLAPVWNGHWTYSAREWQLVRGHRKFLLNREPLSAHLAYARKAGFEVLSVEREQNTKGLDIQVLTQYCPAITADDAQTPRAMLLLRKPRQTEVREKIAVL